MTPFSKRLKEAVNYASLEWSPTKLGRKFGVSKQTAYGWMTQSQPDSDKVHHVADILGVEARWLIDGDGPMIAVPTVNNLPPDEEDLIESYRKIPDERKESVRLMLQALARVVFLSVIVNTAAQNNAEAAIRHNSIVRDYCAKSLNLLHIFARFLRGFWTSIRVKPALRT